jgi:transcriptional regulator with GAF, ATPase, and Fis domain
VGNTRVVFEGLEEKPEKEGLGFKTMQLLFGRGRKAEGRRDLVEENQWLRQILQITRPLVAELDPDKVLQRIIDTAVDLASAERGFLVVFRGSDLSVEVARNFWRRDVTEPEIEISRSIAERVRAERMGLIVEDASDDERFKEFLSVHALKLRSVLCVPLLARGEVRGVLYLDNRFTRGSFREEDLDILESFADLAAIALANSGAFAAERRRKQELEEEVAKSREELLRARLTLSEKEVRTGLRYSYTAVVAESPAMKRLLAQVDRVIPTNLPVLLEGPSGTGKERIARLIHANGPRAGRQFVVLSCAALPSSLAEVELFGHGRGAYTGAGPSRGGLLEEASGGTLFLEGVDDLDPDSQALFLRVLETGEYRRVGETEPRRADARIICGSGRDLAGLVKAGLFREDLYFRLKGVHFSMPTLAERPEDLPLLLEEMLRTEAPGVRLTPRARKALLLRPWPGNLLELRNEIRRLVTLESEVVDLDDLAPVEPGTSTDLKTAVADLERRMILRSLKLYGGNLTRAAKALGLSRLGLRKKLARLGLRKPLDHDS